MKQFTKDAWKRGELVYAYEQGSDEYSYKDIGPWGQVRNGYCAALGFRWILLRLTGKDLEYNESTRLAKKEDWRITRYHNLTKTEGYDSVLAEMSLKKGMPTTFLGIPSALQIVPHTCRANGCYMLQMKRPGGGHLVCIQIENKGSGRLYRYFDPNYGQFVFTSQDRFLNWYTAFLDTYTNYRTRYTEKTIITPVTLSETNKVTALRNRFGG